jgi:uncharacterized protein with HEPN domain
MSQKDDSVFIEHILESIINVENFLKGINKEKFLGSRLIQSAVTRELEIIGEATKNLSENFRKKYSFVPWPKIAGFRDKLAHQYFGINMDRVWNILEIDLPELKKGINKIKLN